MLNSPDDGNALTNDDPRNFDPDVEISEILGRIVGDGRELAEAEFELLKAKTLSEATRYKKPIGLLIAGIVFALAGIIVLVGAIGAALATLIGPLAGGLIAVGAALGIGILCIRSALAQMEKMR